MIDLHTHTDRSDGTFAPAELIAEGVRVGLHAIAITDHDTMLGYDAAREHAADAGLELIPGIELSTRYQGYSVHLLGYFPDGGPREEFREWLDFLLESRRDRNRRMIEKLRSLGIDLTLEEVERKGRTLTARPHFARALMEKGYVKSIQEAFELYLDESAKGYVQRQEVPIGEAIRRILEAGGAPSLAHPVRIAKSDRTKLTAFIEDFVSMGLRAIEVYHSDHTPENAAFYKSLAERYGLAITGGSDFHGANKPMISLGTGLHGNLCVSDELLEELRARMV